MFDARVWLNVGLVLFLALGCAAGSLTGPSTIRCTGGAKFETYAPRTTIECGDELVLTGSLSDNGAAAATGIIGYLSGRLWP